MKKSFNDEKQFVRRSCVYAKKNRIKEKMYSSINSFASIDLFFSYVFFYLFWLAHLNFPRERSEAD